MGHSIESEPSGVFSRYRRLSLGLKILIFMGVGVVVGLVAGERALILEPLGDLFIRLLMIQYFVTGPLASMMTLLVTYEGRSDKHPPLLH